MSSIKTQGYQLVNYGHHLLKSKKEEVAAARFLQCKVSYCNWIFYVYG
jgi:hypothetical protein